MFGDEDGPKDWEIKDEEPPERLQKKWDRDEAADRGTVLCPSCQKETPACNLTCIFCGAPIPQGKTPWYARTAILVISFLAVGPFALPLVWLNPVYSCRHKILLTVIVLVLTCVLAAVFLRAVGTILDYYKQAGIF